MNYTEIGKDVIKYFDYILLSYFMTLLIVSVNMYKAIYDFSKVKKGIKRVTTSLFDVIITIMCGASQIFGIIFTGILTDTYSSKWFNVLLVVSIISVIFFLVQLIFYNKICKNVKS